MLRRLAFKLRGGAARRAIQRNDRLRIEIGGMSLAAPMGAAGHAAPTVISYATRDGFYDRLLDRMAASARGAGLAVSTETIPPCDRKAATLFKPSFIKFKLMTLGGPVLWVDADSVFLVRPDLAADLAAGDFDIGLLRNDRGPSKAWGGHANPWAACLLYLNYSEGAFRLLDTWIALCANDLVKGYDHERLGLALAAVQGQGQGQGQVRLRDLSAAVDGRFERDAGLRKQNRAWG